MTATQQIQFGEEHPYDDEYDGPVDWAHRAARGVIADLQDRCVIKWGFNDIDSITRSEMVATLADIIRVASTQQNH